MLLLTATNHALELETSVDGSIDWHASWVDLVPDTGPGIAPGSTQGNIAVTTTTTIVAAPGASTFRQVKAITVRNRAESPNTVTLKKDVSGTEFHVFGALTLRPGETLTYEDGEGFRFFDANGFARATDLVLQVPGVLMAPHFATAGLVSTKTLTNGVSFAVYVGKAPRSLTSALVRWRVTTAASSVTWAELALAKGPVAPGANPVLTVVGWSNITGVITGTGQKTTAVNVAAGQTLGAGDDLWVVLGNDTAVTAGVVRAHSMADDLQVGVQASVSSRPSLNVGTAQAFTKESATALAPWVGVML